MKKNRYIINLTSIIILSFILLLAAQTTAKAAVNNHQELKPEDCKEYFLEEPYIRILLPSDLCIITRNKKESDDISRFGITWEDFAAIMEEQSSYIDALEENIAYEIVLTKGESSGPDAKELSDSDFEILVETTNGTFEEMGIDILKNDLYENEQARYGIFYTIWVPEGGTQTQGLEYSTTVNGYFVNIVLQSYDGPIDEYKEELMRFIVDNISFEKEDIETEITASGTGFFGRK